MERVVDCGVESEEEGMRDEDNRESKSLVNNGNRLTSCVCRLIVYDNKILHEANDNDVGLLFASFAHRKFKVCIMNDGWVKVGSTKRSIVNNVECQ